MFHMKLIARNILLAVTIGFATYTPLQHASAQGGVSHDDRQRFTIAVPDFPDSSTSDGASWSAMAQAIASDLRASGRFELIESNLPVESNVPAEGRVDAVPHFDRWRETAAKWLVTGRVRKRDQRLLVEFRLWNVVNGHQVLGQQYYVAGSEEDLQRVPHVTAEEILKLLTGGSGASKGAEDHN
jgi:Tol biopolymer transport system component